MSPTSRGSRGGAGARRRKSDAVVRVPVRAQPHVRHQDPARPERASFDIAVNIGRITGSAAWDTRDDPSDATRGSLFSSSLEYAPEAAGSDIRFIRQVSQAYYFRPWRGAVLASAARLGLVRPIGGQELIPSERFFAGGPGTVRGVPQEQPRRARFLRRPRRWRVDAGARTRKRASIYKWLRGVGFIDAGNVFPKAGDLRLGDLVGSVGRGCGWATPFVLLRLDYAKPSVGGTARSFRSAGASGSGTLSSSRCTVQGDGAVHSAGAQSLCAGAPCTRTCTVHPVPSSTVRGRCA